MPNHLKFVYAKVGDIKVKVLIDSGSTRTCVRKSSPLISKLTIKPSKIRLLCANSEFMTSDGVADMTLDFRNYSLYCHATIVENLSADVILGLDYIRSLEFSEDKPFIRLNGHDIPLANPTQPIVAHVNHTTFLEPKSYNTVEVKNHLFDQPEKHVFCQPLDKHKEKRFTIMDSLHENSPILNVVINNNTDERIRLPKTLPICLIDVSKIDHLDAIREIPDSPAENKIASDFRNSRRDKAKEENFNPEIASYGDTTSDEKSLLKNIVDKNKLAFSMGCHDIGKLSYFRYCLPLLDETQTAYQPQRPIPEKLKEKVETEINNWRALGMISPTQSGFNIPLLILKKGDNSIRISLDARELNKHLIKDRFPLPHVCEVFSKIGARLSRGENCYISTFDWFRAYWAVQVDESDEHKLSFSYGNRHFKSQRMLYGTSTAPSAFARIMMKIFGDHPSFFIYLDDLICIDTTFEDHVKSLEFVFQQCIKYGILLNPKKTKLCANEIDFLGYKIDRFGIHPLEKHVEAIRKFPTPQNRPELKRFLGMANYSLKFVPDGSTTLTPLYKCCSVKREFDWGTEEQEAFESIKEKLASAPGLRHRNPDLPLILVNDAAKNRIGSVLYQKNGDVLEPIGYHSRTLNGPDSRRPSRHKELLALCFGIRHFEYYLIGATFTVVSDHKSLLYLFREHLKTELDMRLVNVFHYLQRFTFNILHRPGDSDVMVSADCLSRLPKTSFEDMEDEIRSTEIPDHVFSLVHTPDQFESTASNPMKLFLRAFAKPRDNSETAEKTINEPNILQFGDYEISRKEMIELQTKCPEIKNVLLKLEKKSKRICKNFKLENGLLVNTAKRVNRPVLPSPLSKEFINYVHTVYEHPGQFQMLKLLARNVHILSAQEKVSTVLRQCVTCIKTKNAKMFRPSMVEIRQYESAPFTKTSVDLYDLGKNDITGKRYLVTAVCHLTGFLDGEPISSKSDNLVSEALLKLILRHGISESIVSDNGREFGPKTTQLFNRFNLRHIKVSAYNSRGNSQVERSHRNITEKFKTLGIERRNWSKHWPYVQMLLNNVPKVSLDGLTASEALYGRSLFQPLTKMAPIERDNKVPYIEGLSKYLEEIHPSILQFQVDRHEKLLKKDQGDSKNLSIGQKVLIWKPVITDGKLSKLWEGPYTVTAKRDKHSYVIKSKNTRQTYFRHRRHLRPLPHATSDDAPDPEPNSNPEPQTKNENDVEICANFSQLPYPC